MSPNHQHEFSNIRLSDCQQVFSNTWSPDYKQGFSDKQIQIASNQSDACPRHLTMLVTSCWRHHAKGEGIHVIYHTPPTENLLKTKYTVKHGLNSCNKGLTKEMVPTAATVTSTMQIVEYHVKYNTTTDQTHLKQITVVVGGKGKPRKKGYHCSYKYYLKHIVRVLLERGHNRHLVLLPRQTHAVSLLK